MAISLFSTEIMAHIQMMCGRGWLSMCFERCFEYLSSFFCEYKMETIYRALSNIAPVTPKLLQRIVIYIFK